MAKTDHDVLQYSTYRAVAQRWEALEAVARADTAESTGTQMLSDLAEKLRQGFALKKKLEDAQLDKKK